MAFIWVDLELFSVLLVKFTLKRFTLMQHSFSIQKIFHHFVCTPYVLWESYFFNRLCLEANVNNTSDEREGEEGLLLLQPCATRICKTKILIRGGSHTITVWWTDFPEGAPPASNQKNSKFSRKTCDVIAGGFVRSVWSLGPSDKPGCRPPCIKLGQTQKQNRPLKRANKT